VIEIAARRPASLAGAAAPAAASDAARLAANRPLADRLEKLEQRNLGFERQLDGV